MCTGEGSHGVKVFADAVEGVARIEPMTGRLSPSPAACGW